MAQSRKRTLAGQCPCPVQGGPSTPAALGFTAALVDSHTVWQGTPVWSDLPAAALALSCTDSELSSVELACCLHPFVVWSSWDVLSLVLLDMLSVSWVLGKAWVSHLFFFFPLVWIWKNPKTMTQEPSLWVSHGTLYPPLEKACPRKRGHSLNS